MNITKYVLSASIFFAILVLESFLPLFKNRQKRWRHGFRNISIVVIDNLVFILLLAAATSFIFEFAEVNKWSLSRLLNLPVPFNIIFIIIVFDLWMYIWHRITHYSKFVWRFHRMHHSDNEMDVTTALRFHPGEIIISTILRWGIFVILGMKVTDLIIYETIMLPIIFLQHSNFYMPFKIDKILRSIIITPWMHWVHHSQIYKESNTNFGTIFSWWDRLGKTFSLKEKPVEIIYGNKDIKDPHWQTIVGMIKTPFVSKEKLSGVKERNI